MKYRWNLWKCYYACCQMIYPASLFYRNLHWSLYKQRNALEKHMNKHLFWWTMEYFSDCIYSIERVELSLPSDWQYQIEFRYHEQKHNWSGKNKIKNVVTWFQKMMSLSEHSYHTRFRLKLNMNPTRIKHHKQIVMS